jgi:hypothetical protein
MPLLGLEVDSKGHNLALKPTESLLESTIQQIKKFKKSYKLGVYRPIGCQSEKRKPLDS